MHAGSDHGEMFPAVQTRCIPGLLVVIPGGFVNNTVLEQAERTGEPDSHIY